MTLKGQYNIQFSLDTKCYVLIFGEHYITVVRVEVAKLSDFSAFSRPCASTVHSLPQCCGSMTFWCGSGSGSGRAKNAGLPGAPWCVVSGDFGKHSPLGVPYRVFAREYNPKYLWELDRKSSKKDYRKQSPYM
jgi:hypothetical protein